MNTIKQDRYREAYSRIDSAISSGFSFEAIAIVESILSDRICSFLRSIDKNKHKDLYQETFFQLIKLWRDAVCPSSIWDECPELIRRVDSWRKKRNKYIHGLVKFPRGKPQVESTETFLEDAKKAAIDGKQLSREVSNWRQRQITRKRKSVNQVTDIMKE